MSINEAHAAVSALEHLDEEHLFAELGQRLHTFSYDAQLSGHFHVAPPQGAEAMGLYEDFRAFGKRFFTRVSHEVYNLVCGADVSERQDREKLATAAGLGKESFAATLATLIVSQLGLAPAVATVVALLVVRLVFKPALASMCDVWKGTLTPIGK
jgi:hypothetical protein